MLCFIEPILLNTFYALEYFHRKRGRERKQGKREKRERERESERERGELETKISWGRRQSVKEKVIERV
jgi:hypothetical protein